jgi:hypothetical protein
MEAVDFLLEPLRSGIGLRALLELALTGAFCGALGFWIVTERLTYGAESLSHGMLPGLVLAALAGASLLLGAVAGALAAAVLVALAARDERIGADTATAVAVTGLVGLGALLALAPDAPQRLEELLFGDLLGVTDADLVAAALLLSAGGAALTALHRPLAATAFDAPGAAARGRDRGRRTGPGGAAGTCGAGGPARGRAPPRRHAGRDDAGRGGAGRGRGARGDRAVLPRRIGGGRVGGAGALRGGGCGGGTAYAIAGRGRLRREMMIAVPRASNPMLIS